MSKSDEIGAPNAGNYITLTLKPTMQSDGGITWECLAWAPNGPDSIGKYIPALCKTVSSTF